MSWQDRIKTASYTSATGRTISFDFEDVSRSTNKKHAVFEYPQAKGANVQDLKIGARRFPLRIFIHGENYDLDADLFYDMLEEDGNGTLAHPFYGTFTVYPTSITRIDNLTTAGGQAVFDVEFVESNLDPSPLLSQDDKSRVAAAVDELSSTGAESVAETMQGRGPTAFQKFTEKLKEVNGFVKQYVRPVLIANNIDTSTFDRLNRGINLTDQLADGDVEGVSKQLNFLIRSGESAQKGGPGAYLDLTNALVNLSTEGSEQFDIVEYAAQSTVGAMSISTASTDYSTRQEAINDAENLSTALTTVTDWSDENG